MIERLELKEFTAFESLDLQFSPGINVIIGQNGTGKTHILKVLYAMAWVNQHNVLDKMLEVFMPMGANIDRLVRRSFSITESNKQIATNPEPNVQITIDSNRSSISIIKSELSSHNFDKFNVKLAKSVFIPVKEFLSHAPGFISLYENREIHFDGTYKDLLSKALLPSLRTIENKSLKAIVSKIEKEIGGKVVEKNGMFFLKTKSGEIEFDLLAEGTSKLGLLWLLIKNGSLQKGSTLFWDEPEANINPSSLELVVDVMLELQRQGVQIFLATHNDVILKMLDLRKKSDDDVKFFSLQRNDSDNEISVLNGNTYLDIFPNSISQAYDIIYDENIKKSFGRLS
jgi:AAA15 family ATPase/GTPase